MTNAQPNRLTHAELAPATWFTDRDNSSVWMAGYRVFRARNHEEIARQPVVIDFTQARVLRVDVRREMTDERRARALERVWSAPQAQSA